MTHVARALHAPIKQDGPPYKLNPNHHSNLDPTRLRESSQLPAVFGVRFYISVTIRQVQAASFQPSSLRIDACFVGLSAYEGWKILAFRFCRPAPK